MAAAAAARHAGCYCNCGRCWAARNDLPGDGHCGRRLLLLPRSCDKERGEGARDD